MNTAPPNTLPQPLTLSHLGRVLVLIPHPDDEAIGCGGLLAKLADLGIPCRVILASNGDGAGEIPQHEAEQRLLEFQQSLSALRFHDSSELWRLPDGRLSEHQTELREKLNNSIRDFQPTLLVAPWPDDAHSDHSALGQLAELAEQVHTFSQGLLFYEVWSPLPANRILDITDVVARKQMALQQHQTALKYGNYLHAMNGLSAYRSLCLPNPSAKTDQFAEAYYATTPEQSSGLTQRVRFANNSDGQQISRLFMEVFGTALPDNWWAYKYGREVFPGTVAFDQQDNLLAFYGVLERQASDGCHAVRLCQHADVMVKAETRFATRGNGVFNRISQHFFNLLLGTNQYFQLNFGFPTDRALRLGEVTGMYSRGDELCLWKTPTLSPSPMRKINHLLMRCRVDSARNVGDFNWLQSLTALPCAKTDVLHFTDKLSHWPHRFAQHPEKHYQLLRLYRAKRLIAAAVLYVRDQQLEIMDIALRRSIDLSALMSAIHRHAHRLQLPTISAWGSRFALAHLPAGELSSAGHMALPAPQFNCSLLPVAQSRFWVLGGDTDFR